MIPSGNRADLVKELGARIDDLRAEFEAQLRAIARVEEGLRKVDGASDEGWRAFEKVLQRDLADMLTNNRDIRTVLTDLKRDFGKPARKTNSQTL